VHLPWQFVMLVWHETAHAPFTHFEPASHTVPQAPQLLLSDWKLTHCVCAPLPHEFGAPEEQLSWQTPAEHCCPLVQGLSQAPQLELSACKLTYVEPQRVIPA
jgi:hypothetical protein